MIQMPILIAEKNARFGQTSYKILYIWVHDKFAMWINAVSISQSEVKIPDWARQEEWLSCSK